MGKDLFQINSNNDIYFTLDLWAMLSPHLTHGGTYHRVPARKDVMGKDVSKGGSEVKSGEPEISGK